MNNLKNYLPQLYTGVLEMEAILNAETVELANFEVELTNATNNQYVQTANSQGLQMFEEIFGIIANPTEESIQFRRQRILTRFLGSGEVTKHSLKAQIDTLLNTDDTEIIIDYNAYTIRIVAHVGIFNTNEKLQEMAKLVTFQVPANMVKYLENEVIQEAYGVYYSGAGAVITTQNTIIS